jgi:hypothetical protein
MNMQARITGCGIQCGIEICTGNILRDNVICIEVGMIQISVIADDKTREVEPWWENFWIYYRDLGFDMNIDSGISAALAEWRAINIVSTTYIQFHNENDYLLFRLRWE